MSDPLRYATLLIVDSDPDSLSLKRRVLNERGFNCYEATTGEAASKLLNIVQIDLLLASMYLNDLDATNLCREMRRSHPTLLIVCGKSYDPYDEVASLEAGADDYIAEPIVPAVLIARVRALLRRALPRRTVNRANLIGDLVFDDDKLQISFKGAAMNLTPTEIKLLMLLGAKPNHAITRDDILHHVWNTSYLGDKRVVDTHVRNLRRKLREVDSRVHVQSVRGVGYRLLAETVNSNRSQSESFNGGRSRTR